MRNIWHSDKRDITKWGVLLTLAKQERIRRIICALYYREVPLGSLLIDGKSHPIPKEVVRHFRDIRGLAKICAGVQVTLVDTPIVSDRSKNTQVIIETIRKYHSLRKIVFLDPDTGLEPRKAKLEHVRNHELSEIYRALSIKDLIVFYQHASRSRVWMKEKKLQFEKCLGLPRGAAKIAQAKGPHVGEDVALFYAYKT